ncbi:TonB-dependent receptor plug domain-containing protein, partial [Escherichia coli]|nr:TonB-dependent receptor plug domain-containing protein [Escherichia coli]
SVSGGAGRPQNITIRGMTGNRIMIIRDGIRSADGFGANDNNDKVGRDTFDLSNLESLEVVKGASSSVLGSGAIGGAV